MSNPSDLLLVARMLSTTTGTAPPTDAQLRRAISTAYYALFHKILRSAAERFAGSDQDNTPAFSLLYRAFDHRRMKAICESLQAPTLSKPYQNHLRRTTVSSHMRDFAVAFTDLRAARVRADYEPSGQFLSSDASSLIDSAQVAIEAFDQIPPSERADVLALMMVGART